MNQIVRFLDDILKWGLEKVGLYYSKYRGFVFDREDPKGYGRLKVAVPEIMGDMVLNYWAWPANNYSGIGYGSQVLPRTNDMVWVEFEKGNPRKPIWSFGYFSKDEKPEELKDYDNYWFKTPKGHLIELDDTDEIIRITAANGKVIEISEVISLGTKGGSDEPGVLGNTLQSQLEELIEILKAMKINTNMGPQGILPNFVTNLNDLKGKLEQIKSETITLDK